MISQKIFVDCHVFDYGFQGTRTYIQGLYLELIKNKEFDFYFAATDVENLKSVFGEANNIFYIQYKLKSKFFRLLFDIPAIIKKHKIDYAHFQYIVPPIKNCKYITSTHDVLFLDFPDYFPKLNSLKNKILYGYSAKKSDIILTGSKFSKASIEHHFGIKNVHVTVYGVEDIFYQAYNKAQVQAEVRDKFGYTNTIIYISRHEPRKNHYRLLQSFIDLKLYENHHLLLIGDITFHDDNFDKLLANVPKEIKNKVILLNKVEYKNMLLLLRAASLSIYPSIAEGFGLPPLESVAAKVPTLCSNKTSMGEFEFFGEDFINPYDLNEMKSKISSKLLHIDFKRQEELSKFVADNYSWEIAANSVLEIVAQSRTN
jgi:glycosyltransferase involved in cell wall biosynthesis